MTAEESEKQAERIRALLAKAESTTFEAEADALIQKAQELMSQYAIDELQLMKGGKEGLGEIVTERHFIEAPHADMKITGLHWIAVVNDCKVVLGEKVHGPTKYQVKGQNCWITGYKRDVDRVLMLFGSLLIQCTAQMLKADRAYVEVTVFRRGFIIGYFEHVAEILEQRSIKKAAERGDASLLPVLRDKMQSVDEAFRERWGKLRSSRGETVDYHARSSGVRAAQSADLGDPRIRPTGVLNR